MEKYYFLTHDNHDPYFNLASEEYLLKQKGGNYFYLWINAPAVIVGINQNALEEVNLDYTEKNGIKVVRRLTGGGAVYHDFGNLCYTVISPESSAENSFIEFLTPIVEYLKTLGLNAEFSGRNDLLIDGKKISGSAKTSFNGKSLHHGTILFDTDTSVLSLALKPNKLKIESKGIKSVRSRVANVSEYLNEKISLEEFKLGLSNFLLTKSEKYEWTDEDLKAIDKLVKEKYSTYEWNIARSPKGNYSFEDKFEFGIIKFTFDVKGGVMDNVAITGDFFSLKDINLLANKLNGVKFERKQVESVLSEIKDYILNADATEIVDKMFR